MNKTELALGVIKGIKVDLKKIGPELRQRQGCFVTVYVKGKLRGCIGNIEPIQPLYQAIISNSVAAASKDWRFEPIKKEELDQLKIEVSVLSPLKPFQPKNNEERLQWLNENKPGLVIEKSGRRAVFLPQVWKELPQAEEFLNHLCFKAGLAMDSWKNGMKFWTFTVEK